VYTGLFLADTITKPTDLSDRWARRPRNISLILGLIEKIRVKPEYSMEPNKKLERTLGRTTMLRGRAMGRKGSERGFSLAILSLSLVVLLGMLGLAIAVRQSDLRAMLPQVSTTIFGALYTFAPWRCETLLRVKSVHWLFFAVALNWAGYSIAYYLGRRFGKHRLAPLVSPKKSWEGAAASVAGSVIFGMLYMGHFMPEVPLWHVAGIAVISNIAGQIGDLAESAIKRGAGVKDSGTMLPGHGGMLAGLRGSRAPT